MSDWMTCRKSSLRRKAKAPRNSSTLTRFPSFHRCMSLCTRSMIGTGLPPRPSMPSDWLLHSFHFPALRQLLMSFDGLFPFLGRRTQPARDATLRFFLDALDDATVLLFLSCRRLHCTANALSQPMALGRVFGAREKRCEGHGPAGRQRTAGRPDMQRGKMSVADVLFMHGIERCLGMRGVRAEGGRCVLTA